MPSDEELRRVLDPLQYAVSRGDGTEPPFQNEFWNSHAEGIYVDLVSGEPLFASVHKYDSGTGWPSFFKALEPQCLIEKSDFKLGVERVEIRSRYGNSHLGHVFDDGPAPTGKRFCMNSSSLGFIAKDEMRAAGYEDYLDLFERKTS